MEVASEIPQDIEINNHFKYDAIVVLGAVMTWNDKTSSWEFPTIIEKYPGKLVEGKARAIATKEIQDLAPIILVTGGSDTNPKTGQQDSRAEELRRLITEKYKVPPSKVKAIGSESKGTTKGNVDSVVEYLLAYPDLLLRKKNCNFNPPVPERTGGNHV